MRKVHAKRKTKEVDITLELNVDGKGNAKIKTGIKFLDHMLLTLAKHGLFDLQINATGDLTHHVAEDVALVLGEALNKATNQGKGIKRFGSAYVPMDESLARATVDLAGRPYCIRNLRLLQSQIEDLKTEDMEHFFESLAQAAKANIHVTVLYGSNEHHKVEAAMKALALALREAFTVEPRIGDQVPSAKGVL
ncbi:MAG: imidazoleglycerol-phosphate dehydratase HisB [Candidatus Bathyarchaeota archaeon]|nr:imidazoleglycerol-phosphate dehydratase HisB [Candidatus Bathyarchaeum tardum]WGM89078.1 MAG: imidazoleglycerol-phosphate dehydratase HisB [Candidatus Bathyarchaeum tardum]